MTREEIIQGLQFTIDMFLFNPSTGEIRAEHTLNDMDKTTVDACREAIKALEQEPVLDKIRAEIKALTSNRGFLSCSIDHIHEEIDAVFDKYKAEKEQK